MNREVGGDERDGDADEEDNGDEQGVAGEVARVEESEVELLVEHVDGTVHKNHGEGSAEEAVEDATPEEGTSDEAHFGTHHAHSANGVPVGVDSNLDGGADKSDRDNEEENDKDDEEPGEFVEDLAEVVEHSLVVGDAVDDGVFYHFFFKSFALFDDVRGAVGRLERDHESGVERVDAVEDRDNVLVEFVGEESSSLISGDIVDRLDIVQIEEFLTEAESFLFGGFGVEVDLVGDAFLEAVSSQIGVVFNEEEEAEDEKDEHDAEDSGSAARPEADFSVAFIFHCWGELGVSWLT